MATSSLRDRLPREKVEAYLQEAVAGVPAAVQAAPGRGLCLRASAPIPKGAVVLREDPLFFAQHPCNAVRGCAWCSRATGSLLSHIKYAIRQLRARVGRELEDPSESVADLTMIYAAVEAHGSSALGESDETALGPETRVDGPECVVCSAACGRALASWRRAVPSLAGRHALAPADLASAPAHPAEESCVARARSFAAFLDHALQTREIFMLGFYAYAFIKETFDATRNLEQALLPVFSLHSVPWHMQCEDDETPEDRRDDLLHSLQYLRDIFYSDELAILFEPETYDQILGAISVNGIGATFTSPLWEYVEVVSQSRAPQEILDILALFVRAVRGCARDLCDVSGYGSLDELCADELGIDTYVGTGIYRTASLMNHSDHANVSLEFLGTNTLVAVSTRDINEGEELVISYFDSDLSPKEREGELERYGIPLSPAVNAE